MPRVTHLKDSPTRQSSLVRLGYALELHFFRGIAKNIIEAKAR